MEMWYVAPGMSPQTPLVGMDPYSAFIKASQGW